MIYLNRLLELLKKNLTLYLLVLLSLSIQLISNSVQAEELAIIVNRENPVKDISLRDVRAYFLKEKIFWSTGDGVVPLDLTPGALERGLFLHHVINKSEVELEEYWILRKQTEAQYAPQQISSSKMMIKLVGALKWAIGYVDSKYLNPETLKKIKVVEVIK